LDFINSVERLDGFARAQNSPSTGMPCASRGWKRSICRIRYFLAIFLGFVLLVTSCKLLWKNVGLADTSSAPIEHFPEEKIILDSSGQYRIHPWKFQKNGAEGSLLSLVSHCTISHFNLLPTLAKRWQGPISLAIFVPNGQLQPVILQLGRLRQCHHNLKRFLDVHFVTLLTAHDQNDTSTKKSQQDAQQDIPCSEVLKLDRFVEKTCPFRKYK
jgi:Glycosyl-transferase for dystroglycan